MGKKKEAPAEEQAKEQAKAPEPEEKEQAAAPEEETVNWEEKYNEAHDSYLRLAADYDNFRKRTVKEKEQSYGHGKADAIEKLLPIYDNLERAVNQETKDDAFKKGVEMTLTQLVSIMESLGAEIFGQVGDTFDPNIHNAVMHIEDESLGENIVAQVFQKGFKLGEKIVRFAMVQVAN